MSYETLLVSQRDGLTTITLNRPDRLNALSFQLLDELHAALKLAAEDAECRCVLLTGAGRGFSSGADLVDAVGGMQSGERPDLGAALKQRYNPILQVIRAMKKPVVAAINGTAAGAGLNIALACDFVLATASAKLIQSFVNIGLVPDAGGTWTVPRLIGRARAARWLMSGEVLDAQQALDWGLLSDVYPDENFAQAAEDLAWQLSQRPTVALAAIKQLIDQSSECNLDQQLALEASTQTRVGFTDDAWEGITAFVQKRPAQFQGR